MARLANWPDTVATVDGLLREWFWRFYSVTRKCHAAALNLVARLAVPGGKSEGRLKPPPVHLGATQHTEASYD